MVQRFLWGILLSAIIPWVALSAQEYNDVPKDYRSEFQKASRLAKRSPGKAVQDFKALYQKLPDSFTVTYEYARILATLKKYQDASSLLNEAIELREQKGKGDVTVYNTKGYVLAMLQKHEEALGYYKKEENSPDFSKLDKTSRMKLLNNTGFSLLKLDRYEEAVKYFKKAKKLGSSLAKSNLRVVQSILDTLNAESKDVPGIFAPVIDSTRDISQARQKVRDLASTLDVKPSELNIFETNFRKNRYVITWGANQSYPLAEERMRSARDRGFEGAWIASVIDWKEMTKAID